MGEKMEFSKMKMDMDTHVFTAKRAQAIEMVNAVCDLPDRLCASMKTALMASNAKFHKKTSAPLDDNRGSYVAVWMWVRPTGVKDEIEVAFKSASMAYQLRDVVTYQEQIDEEPVIRCSQTLDGSVAPKGQQQHRQTCQNLGMKRTSTPIPVFKQAVLKPKEMALVDSMMERMLAQKVLENTGHRATSGSLPGSAAGGNDGNDDEL